MCVTFSGRGLLCSGTLSWQQSSHATLKPKLQVQIKRMVMKDLKKKKKKTTKAGWSFTWIKPMSDGEQSVRLFGFPNGWEEGHEPHMQRLLGWRPRLGHLHQPHIQAEVGRGPGVNCCSISSLGRRGPWGLRQMDLEARVPGGYW